MWQKIVDLYYKLSSPKSFYSLTGSMLPWFSVLGLICIVAGFTWGLLFAPADYQQGDVFRIFYVHVPSAILAQSIYFTMALTSAIGLIWRIKLAHMVASACAPIGASFTVLALSTGSIWGKPTWGTWWVWDARLTSMLMLLFLYIGFIALQSAVEERSKSDRASALLAVVGVINLPIIKYSVEWWETLHQGATFTLTEKPAIHSSMLTPFLLSLLGFYLLLGAFILLRTRCEVLAREYNSRWVKALVEPGNQR